MTTVVHDFIADELATIERLEPTPLAPFGYGQDLDCETDLYEDMREVDPSSRRALAQALLRRLSCPRGRLPDDPDYGFDLRGALNRGTDSTSIRALSGDVKAELMKDDRIEAVEVSAAYTESTKTLDVKIWVSPIDPAIGEFSLTIAVVDGAELLAEVSA